MRDGFIKVAAVTPKVRVADVDYNMEQVLSLYREAAGSGAKIIVFPELVLTAYTCQDLFLQSSLLKKARLALKKLVSESEGTQALTFAGLPLEVDGKLYNVAAAFTDGELLGFVPKANIPNYSEYYEQRHFTEGTRGIRDVLFFGEFIPFGTDQLFVLEREEEEVPGGLKVAAEICEDLWVADTPSTAAALAGANVIVNLSASVEVAGKTAYRRNLVKMTSARLVAGYIYTSAGEGESSQDLVFCGQRMIAENGALLADSGRFTTGITYGEIDVDRLRSERRRMTTYHVGASAGRMRPLSGGGLAAGALAAGGSNPADGLCMMEEFTSTYFDLDVSDTELSRRFDPRPFVPSASDDRTARCEEIFSLQALGLKKRLEHIGAKNVVIGISGGLDSTLALLVAARAFDMLGLDRSGILAVTMPAFGTTDRTYRNACTMSTTLGCTLKEINIKNAVMGHFADIGHDPEVMDVTYENSQARERTQVLMDLANQTGGIVVGTGDLSELALGWATYNGDHMSMYAVNSSVPKTLVRHLVRYYADTCGEQAVQESSAVQGGRTLQGVLMDVLDTPVSPELLPPKDGEISQKTEDLVGPYELHDFFLYYVLRFGFAPHKVYRIAQNAFAGEFDDATILKWLRKFYWRFFSQQYKRSCVPDGPKVGSAAVSPRGDLRMPSDAVCRLWQEDLEGLG